MDNRKLHFYKEFAQQPQQYGAVRLEQIGDLYGEAGYESPAHRQTCHEISYVVSGAGTFYCNQIPLRVEKGDMVLSPLDSEHRIVSSRYAPLRFYYCAFSFDREHPSYGCFQELERLLLNGFDLRVTDYCGLERVFQILLSEIQAEHKNKAAVMEAGLTQLLLFAQRNLEGLEEESHWLKKENRTKKQLVAQTVHYLDGNLLSLERLSDLSQVFGYSYSYITQAFTAVMGISLQRYYQQERLKLAESLLKQEFSVTRVAEMLNFESLPTFSRAFKSVYGVSPNQWRKNDSVKNVKNK